MRSHASALLVATAIACRVPSAGAEEASPAAGREEAKPFASDDARVRELWAEGVRLELEGDLLGSAGAYERIVAVRPTVSEVYWRIARNHFRAGEALSTDDRDGRMHHFELTERWAARGAAIDPECAECFLYQFVGTSGVARTGGTLAAAARVSTMAKLLDHAFALRPGHVDNEWNSELANLYYAGGVFYRSLPDQALFGWVTGARADRQRALGYLREAVAITPTRIDYNLELGALLACLGRTQQRPELVTEGLATLAGIEALAERQARDSFKRRHARIIVAHPDKACDDSREDWVAADPSGRPVAADASAP